MVELDRRQFLTGAAATLAAAPLGTFGAGAMAKADRELTAIGRATEWLNSQPLAPDRLAGKVVLVDFCTYTCINWLRTLPYVRAWARKYANRLVVIGVHTPEFAFEKHIDNVRRAVRQLKIDYPMVIDNDYAIWRAFRNQYWPALYFIDTQGRIRQHHFGEGEYERSEKTIQQLLAEAGASGSGGGVVTVEASGVEAPADWENLRSPENYVGYNRTQNFASPRGADQDRRATYAIPPRLSLNEWALAGEWTIGGQATLLTGARGRLAYRFHARDLHLVMGPATRGATVTFSVSVDGRPPGPARGLDVDENGNGAVIEQRLYQLIRQPKPILDRTFEIAFDSAVETLAFTFG